MDKPPEKIAADVDQLPDVPLPLNFCVNTPLYERFSTSGANAQACRELEKSVITLDAYCAECGSTSTFTSIPITEPSLRTVSGTDIVFSTDHIFQRTLKCARLGLHQIHFVFAVRRATIQKIGQFPSLADLAELEISKYRRILRADQFRELSRAVGLAAHGVGIGSFVYLRRIFERLINEISKAAVSEGKIDSNAFANARTDEKIEMLKADLPSFLVENRKIYRILSLGVHQLSEQDCLEAFPHVKVGIELILDEAISAEDRRKKVAAVSKQLTELHNKLKP